MDQVPIRVGMESLMIVEIKLPKKSEDAENFNTNEIQYRIKNQKEFNRILEDSMVDILQNLYGLSKRGRYDHDSREEMEELLAMIIDNNIRIMVPPFIDQGEEIVINTEDMTYLKRNDK